ncbi:hypothetical protein NCS57_01187500 [Fusarium keratoplasticum]|uniref:Uncharacterized protein n=1 Tax=Fusarium keratoplasticum TaxID=1328300 RepID=A0ACC0QNL4_9HYPO|nr:hypothetical protein NCS57_01187500 [Fusarium keratoplasticum]KAI8658069.1 hypothetical protein NCS57_01187500 [Fusarium keratoplasticum]
MRSLDLLNLSVLVTRAVASGTHAWTPRAANDQNCELYSVKDGDTCLSIIRQTNVTFAQIISWNPDLDKQCANITAFAGQDICVSNPEGNYAIPSNSQGSPTIVTTTAPIPDPTPNDTSDRCAEYHLVTAGEDCGVFTVKYGITLKDFIFLNPHVWENCTNVYKDYYYCVRPVGYISTYPGYLPTTSTKEFVQTPFTPLPLEYDPLAGFVSTNPVIPLANKTREDCSSYLYLANITATPNLADCWSMAMVHDITPEPIFHTQPTEHVEFKTGADQRKRNLFSGTLHWPSLRLTHLILTLTIILALSQRAYLIASPSSPLPKITAPGQEDVEAPPSPRAAGEVENCTAWFAPESYHSCESLLLTTWLEFDDFYRMNPSVKSDCTGLAVGTYYCISTNADGSPPLLEDEDTTTTSASATATGTDVVTPSPVQSGIASNCNDFYLVQAGDGCWAIAIDHGIELNDFYEWNPAVKNDCSGLQAKVYVCVGI